MNRQKQIKRKCTRLGISGNWKFPNSWLLSVPKYEETRIMYEPTKSRKKTRILLLIKTQQSETLKKTKIIG